MNECECHDHLFRITVSYFGVGFDVQAHSSWHRQNAQVKISQDGLGVRLDENQLGKPSAVPRLHRGFEIVSWGG